MWRVKRSARELASSVVFGSRVNSGDSPRWRACSQAMFESCSHFVFKDGRVSGREAGDLVTTSFPGFSPTRPHGENPGNEVDLVTLDFVLIGCGDKNTFRDICDRRCKCKNGKLVSCYRVRQDFKKMSLEERTRLIKAFKLLSSDPRYKSDYEKLGKLHTIVPEPKYFYPWHRWYVLELENLLRQIDCRITIPYWEWIKDAAHWTRGSEIEDVWNPGPHGLGGNGVSPFKCVMDGPFQKGEYSLPQSAGGNCLKRHFNYSCNLPNAEQAKKVLKEANYTVFSDTIFGGLHLIFHKCIGASQYFKTAPYNLEFWLHHSFLDKLWVEWEKNNKGSKRGLSRIRYLMYGTIHYPLEYLDEKHLPGDVKVLYEE